jgi:hypothetical protein
MGPRAFVVILAGDAMTAEGLLVANCDAGIIPVRFGAARLGVVIRSFHLSLSPLASAS